MVKTYGDIWSSCEFVKKKLLPTVLANYKFWIFGLFLIYGFVPFFYRAIADVVLGTVWGCIFTYVFRRR